MSYTREQIEAAVKKEGHKWFENGDYNVNIVGVRNSATHNEVTNKFDDWMTISYKVNGEWNFHCYDCTTDPGKYWVDNLMNPDGVAIVVPGQYRSSHKIGLHQGKYEALRQQKPIKVWRDDNKDNVYDHIADDIQDGIFGINIHRATKYPGKESTQVDKWSAGCQVIAAYNDFEEFMNVMYKARDAWSNSFTYTLIESKYID
jgi:hypothetical protein|tara:strand:- start:657 stop:1262 length:606 start_codon:yes stop_codon:yes gene_type:complete